MALCDFDTRVTVYKGYGNPISVVPYRDVRNSLPVNMLAVTRVDVCIGGVTAASNDVPSFVWWDEDDDAVEDDDPTKLWVIHFKPGLIPTLPLGEHNASITVFSPDYPNGLVLTHTYPLSILEIC